MRLPLQGLKVLDLTRVIAGPHRHQTLAAFGAQVLRVDGPRLPELPWQHVDTGFGKRSAVLDASAAGAGKIHELLQDAVPSSWAIARSLGRGRAWRDELAQRYPRLMIAELGAWGYSGPGPSGGFDSVVQAATGIAQAYSGDGRTPGACRCKP